ncbi:Fur-regulated basic protein FbpA [Bacillus sp. T3]|uniref:Fur-regulated basic protein FbpA n=1 Tax=Bacillus sp. T3 TaxID=467262 RepID=UPI00298280D5|nr:Fur-regulated basic protein FbpA [Bacillus sp. T3]
MGEILRRAVKNRRKKLIDALIAFNVYKKEDQHLFELSLTDLENEYKRFQSQCYPHMDFGSIKLMNNIAKK